VWTPGAQIYHATFSPDGAYVLTASDDDLARLWYIKTGKEAAALPHPHRVRYAAFSRDGKMLLTASGQQLGVWDVAAPPQVPSEPKVSLTHDDELVLYGEFSTDGREILSVTFDGTARVWNVWTAQERTELRHSEITLARLSPDGRRMATAAVNVLQIWDTATGAPVGQPVPHERRLTVVAFSPDGRRVVTADEGGWRVSGTPSLAAPLRRPCSTPTASCTRCSAPTARKC
jgi:dipeptidyl aminopeptidase/acylaminoacyl peptidase